MPEHFPDSPDEFTLPVPPGESPLHGYRGVGDAPERLPAGLTVAISREAGARGSTIARLAGRKLGWQVYPQDLLEYVTQDEQHFGAIC